jgi:hypothetical protein
VNWAPVNWAKFNLRSQKRILRIVVINRLDCCIEMLNNTEVNVVDTVTKTSNLCGVIKVKDTRRTKEVQTYTFHSEGLFGNQIMMTDRDVNVRGTLTFAEINVYGLNLGRYCFLCRQFIMFQTDFRTLIG